MKLHLRVLFSILVLMALGGTAYGLTTTLSSGSSRTESFKDTARINPVLSVPRLVGLCEKQKTRQPSAPISDPGIRLSS